MTPHPTSNPAANPTSNPTRTPAHTADPNVLPLPELWHTFAATGLPKRLFELARDEDLGPTAAAATAAAAGDADWSGRVVMRTPGVVAGLACIPELLAVFPGPLAFTPAAADGDSAPHDATTPAGLILGTLRGPRSAVVLAERTLLNLVARLSGIATRTDRFVRALAQAGRPVQLWDTRKTTPGLRLLEKYAVRCGGGFNHRLSLHDAVMIKDNFLEDDDAAIGARVAGMLDAIDARVRTGEPEPRFIEVEVDRLTQLESLLAACGPRIDVVLLDNMSIETLRTAVGARDRLAPTVKLEASGGVTLDTIAEIGSTGIDRISVGSLTHGATSIDIGLDAE